MKPHVSTKFGGNLTSPLYHFLNLESKKEDKIKSYGVYSTEGHKKPSGGEEW